MEKIILINGSLVLDHRAMGEWCVLPYPDHPKGCPNFAKKKTCPPNAPNFLEYIDVCKSLWLIAVEFDLATHMARMKERHPHWSDRQARCLLYWQPSVNKRLNNLVAQFRWEYPDTISTVCPEAMGVQVIETAQKLGLNIQPKPQNKIYKVAIAGYGV